jgi:hypothetical protein
MTPNPTRLGRGFFKNPDPWDDEDFPEQLEEAVKLVAQHRSLDCSFYDRCLTHAGAQRWVNFTCSRCELHGLKYTEIVSVPARDVHVLQLL